MKATAQIRIGVNSDRIVPHSSTDEWIERGPFDIVMFTRACSH